MNKMFFGFVLFSIMFLSSCMSYTGTYKINLEDVENPNIIDKNKESVISKYSYEDNYIKIIWIPNATEFAFTLTNKTDSSVKIIWDDAVYVDEDNSSLKIMHSGVKYIDRNNSQTPTVVIRKAKISDIIIPVDNIYYVSGQYGGWNTLPLLPNSAESQEKLKEISNQYIGKTIKILIPINIKNIKYEYLFIFKVDDFIFESYSNNELTDE